GQYGGGTVMLWDAGTWSPDGDPREGLRTGKFRFELAGKKLHGGWALVRMGGRAGAEGKNWLLIKERDSSASSDGLPSDDRSVATNRTMQEIAAEDGEKSETTPRKARRNRARETGNGRGV